MAELDWFAVAAVALWVLAFVVAVCFDKREGRSNRG